MYNIRSDRREIQLRKSESPGRAANESVTSPGLSAPGVGSLSLQMPLIRGLLIETVKATGMPSHCAAGQNAPNTERRILTFKRALRSLLFFIARSHVTILHLFNS